MIDKCTLNTYIDEQIEYWHPHGAITVTENGTEILTRTYGFSDKKDTVNVGADEKYFIGFVESAFCRFALMMLIDGGKVKFTDTLDKYVPEYAFSHEIQVKHLFEDTSAIPCWYNSVVMVNFDKDAAHLSLPIEKRLIAEHSALAKKRTFADCLALIGNLPLDYAVGLKRRWHGNYSNNVFMREIVERVSGKSMFDYLNENLFVKYGIDAEKGDTTTADSCVWFREKTPVFVPKIPDADGFTLTLAALNKLATLLLDKKIFTAKTWTFLIKQLDKGNEYLFAPLDGWACLTVGGATGMGYTLLLSFNRKTAVTFAAVRDYRCELLIGCWFNFVRKVRGEIQRYIIYPLAPKMVPYSGKNSEEAVTLTVHDDQLDFVSDAQSSLSWAYSDVRHAIPYVLMDDGVSIGILILMINKKINQYYIGIVQIDQRYQGRGYGRFLMNFAVETLKKAGATELTIGVNRNNVAARTLYESVGFKAADVYDHKVSMIMKL